MSRNVTNAGVEVRVGDQEYTLKPLTLEDYEWLELKLRAKAIEAGRMSLAESGVSRSERDAEMRLVLEQAGTIDVFQCFSQLLTPVGVTWMLWRMAVKQQPKIKMDEVAAWVRDRDVMETLMPKIMLLTGWDAKKNETATTKE